MEDRDTNIRRQPVLTSDSVTNILINHGLFSEYNTPVKNSSRKRNLVEWRGMYYNIYFHYTHLTLSEIGQLFRDRTGKPKDHATILHGHKAFEITYKKYNYQLALIYDNIIKELHQLLRIRGHIPQLEEGFRSKLIKESYVMHQRKIIYKLMLENSKLKRENGGIHSVAQKDN
tara:strand:- start:1741 stop:2259 length:519 start_codon:yes stop_codon:yes gene_type:complete